MPRTIKKSRWSAIVLGSLLLLAILIAACGGATTGGGGGSVPQSAPARSAQGGLQGQGGRVLVVKISNRIQCRRHRRGRNT